MMKLPTLNAAEIEHTQQLCNQIAAHIQKHGPISFQDFMGWALYSPGLGYYSSARDQIASQQNLNDPNYPQGDFVTAPELSPWFTRALAHQVKQILNHCSEKNILEFGAGSGILAKELLKSLNNPHIKYYILELSANLKQVQQAQLAEFKDQVIWLDELPQQFIGCVIGNEVLDAMPVRLIQYDENLTLQELYVDLNEKNQFAFSPKTLKEEDYPEGIERLAKVPNYLSEFNEQANAWVRQMYSWLDQGGILLIDYGFPSKEYYHPQRDEGTLMCHYRHLAHADPLIYVGLQDITAHVDFSAIAEQAYEVGFEILGYTSQSNFLINCGILELLQSLNPEEIKDYASQIGPVQKLLSEAEMGELFKVIFLAKELDLDPIGFSRHDRRHQL